jgi:predicted GNAT family N-acyltransferase
MSSQNMSFRIVTGDWESVREDAQKVRIEVFVIEQNVPLELEWDEGDDVSTHAIAYDEQGQAVATGRLLPDGHIGRMAVIKPLRGRGLGREVLQALLHQARIDGHKELRLHAQTHALPFYAQHGFVAEGEEFLEADMPHRLMRLELD